MPKTTAIVPVERIEARILLIRGHRVMLDSDLAEVYGTSTKVLNQAVTPKSPPILMADDESLSRAFRCHPDPSADGEGSRSARSG